MMSAGGTCSFALKSAEKHLAALAAIAPLRLCDPISRERIRDDESKCAGTIVPATCRTMSLDWISVEKHLAALAAIAPIRLLGRTVTNIVSQHEVDTTCRIVTATTITEPFVARISIEKQRVTFVAVAPLSLGTL